MAWRHFLSDLRPHFLSLSLSLSLSRSSQRAESRRSAGRRRREIATRAAEDIQRHWRRPGKMSDWIVRGLELNCCFSETKWSRTAGWFTFYIAGGIFSFSIFQSILMMMICSHYKSEHFLIDSHKILLDCVAEMASLHANLIRRSCPSKYQFISRWNQSSVRLLCKIMSQCDRKSISRIWLKRSYQLLLRMRLSSKENRSGPVLPFPREKRKEKTNEPTNNNNNKKKRNRTVFRVTFTSWTTSEPSRTFPENKQRAKSGISLENKIRNRILRESCPRFDLV